MKAYITYFGLLFIAFNTVVNAAPVREMPEDQAPVTGGLAPHSSEMFSSEAPSCSGLVVPELRAEYVKLVSARKKIDACVVAQPSVSSLSDIVNSSPENTLILLYPGVGHKKIYPKQPRSIRKYVEWYFSKDLVSDFEIHRPLRLKKGQMLVGVKGISEVLPGILAAQGFRKNFMIEPDGDNLIKNLYMDWGENKKNKGAMIRKNCIDGGLELVRIRALLKGKMVSLKCRPEDSATSSGISFKYRFANNSIIQKPSGVSHAYPDDNETVEGQYNNPPLFIIIENRATDHNKQPRVVFSKNKLIGASHKLINLNYSGKTSKKQSPVVSSVNVRVYHNWVENLRDRGYGLFLEGVEIDRDKGIHSAKSSTSDLTFIDNIFAGYQSTAIGHKARSSITLTDNLFFTRSALDITATLSTDKLKHPFNAYPVEIRESVDNRFFLAKNQRVCNLDYDFAVTGGIEFILVGSDLKPLGRAACLPSGPSASPSP